VSLLLLLDTPNEWVKNSTKYHSFLSRTNQNVITPAAKIASDNEQSHDISRVSQSRFQSRPPITIDQPSALWHINTCLEGIQQFLRRVTRVFLNLILCWLVCNPFKLWLQLPPLLYWQMRYHIVETTIFPSVVCGPQNLADRFNNMFWDCEYQIDSIAGKSASLYLLPIPGALAGAALALGLGDSAAALLLHGRAYLLAAVLIVDPSEYPKKLTGQIRGKFRVNNRRRYCSNRQVALGPPSANHPESILLVRRFRPTVGTSYTILRRKARCVTLPRVL
jgi:hypothetical protein